MDTMKDTKMQPATDAVIDKLRKMQPIAWCYEDMLGRKCVGFERPLHRRNTHEPLFSAATRAVVMGLVNQLEAAEKERDDVAQQLVQSERGKRAISEECDALRNEIAYVKEVEFPRKAQAVADAWKGKCKRLEVERDILRAKIEATEEDRSRFILELGRLCAQCDALRAKIEAMERQKPAGKFIQHPSNGLWEQDGYGDNPDARPLYALPGAQGEEK